jgi:surface antigen
VLRLTKLATFGALLSGTVPTAGIAGQRAPVVYGYPFARDCPAAGLADAVDPWKMNTCNCTSYVAWVLTANGQRTDWFVPGAMDARNWPNVALLSGLVVSKRPRVGSVAVWASAAPPFGHVAYVTAVEPGGRIDVSEYNLEVEPGEETFAFDVRHNVYTAGAVFIYVPKRWSLGSRSSPSGLSR